MGKIVTTQCQWKKSCRLLNISRSRLSWLWCKNWFSKWFLFTVFHRWVTVSIWQVKTCFEPKLRSYFDPPASAQLLLIWILSKMNKPFFNEILVKNLPISFGSYFVSFKMGVNEIEVKSICQICHFIKKLVLHSYDALVAKMCDWCVILHEK